MIFKKIKFLYSNINYIRNLCIIAHIDHGKSTLCDRLIEHSCNMKIENQQVLDKLEVEKERGITVKSQTVSLTYNKNGINYELNIIDTPGHADFSYEVKRLMPICEGAVLLIDSTQGIQAQTVAHYNSSKLHGLKLLYAFNKIDLESSNISESKAQLESIVGKEIPEHEFNNKDI